MSKDETQMWIIIIIMITFGVLALMTDFTEEELQEWDHQIEMQIR